MRTGTQTAADEKTPRSVFHPATPEDQAAMAAMRAVIAPQKGQLRGVAARGPYDEIMSRVAKPDGVSYEADTIAGIPGWWCRPEGAQEGACICHFHGGWFNFGSAKAFRHLVGHLAGQAGVAGFVPHYRLAPEHRFPAAIEDAETCLRGLHEAGFQKVVVTGDSAGGNLALLLLSRQRKQSLAAPAGAVALSPTTDLALTGDTWSSRAAVDPYFTRPQVEEMVAAYLGDFDGKDPAVSPLYGDLRGLPPIQIHVGNDEVLLDDSRRYGERAVESGVDATVDVWESMVHGFLSGIGKFSASNEALGKVGRFLRDRLAH